MIIKVFRVSYICNGIQRNWLLRKGHFGNNDTGTIKVSVITVLLTFKFISHEKASDFSGCCGSSRDRSGARPAFDV